MCFDYTLNDNLLVFTNGNTRIECTPNNAGQKVVYGYDPLFYYKCPDIERFRRTMDLYNSHFDSDPFEIQNPSTNWPVI